MISIYYTQCPGRMSNAASIVFDFLFGPIVMFYTNFYIYVADYEWGKK